MGKSFHKSANTLQELHLPHPGIINLESFNKHFRLRCYKPSTELQPFVAHIWTQRQLQSMVPKPTEISSGPNVYLFFTAKTAFVHGPGINEFKYDASMPGVTAGVKFRPGGFYPFLQRSVSELRATTLPLHQIFPSADDTFRKKLLTQPDSTIVTMLEVLLQDHNAKNDKYLKLVTEILDTLDNNASLCTVGELARASGISERWLQLLFQTYVGVGIKWVIARKRLLGAIDRIQTQELLTWTDVATESGYSSQSHFSREFKSIIGLSPSAYSKSLRAE